MTTLPRSQDSLTYVSIADIDLSPPRLGSAQQSRQRRDQALAEFEQAQTRATEDSALESRQLSQAQRRELYQSLPEDQQVLRRYRPLWAQISRAADQAQSTLDVEVLSQDIPLLIDLLRRQGYRAQALGEDLFLSGSTRANFRISW